MCLKFSERWFFFFRGGPAFVQGVTKRLGKKKATTKKEEGESHQKEKKGTRTNKLKGKKKKKALTH